MSYYSNFLSWFYSNKSNSNMIGAARNAPFSNIKECSSNMIVVTQQELDDTITKLRPTKTEKRIIFDPMNDMIAELHRVFKKRGLKF